MSKENRCDVCGCTTIHLYVPGHGWFCKEHEDRAGNAIKVVRRPGGATQPTSPIERHHEALRELSHLPIEEIRLQIDAYRAKLGDDKEAMQEILMGYIKSIKADGMKPEVLN